MWGGLPQGKVVGMDEFHDRYPSSYANVKQEQQCFWSCPCPATSNHSREDHILHTLGRIHPHTETGVFFRIQAEINLYHRSKASWRWCKSSSIYIYIYTKQHSHVRPAIITCISRRNIASALHSLSGKLTNNYPQCLVNAVLAHESGLNSTCH